MAAERFTIFGQYEAADKPNLMAQVFSVLIAAQAFTDPAEKYPWLMSVLVMLGAFWLSYQAWGKRSILGFPASLVFVDPAFGGTLFTNIPVFFFTHAALALLFAAAAYTYLRAPARKKS